MTGTYESYAVLSILNETDNAKHFWKRDPKTTARFLRQQFKSGDSWIAADPVLSRLNVKRIQWLAVAGCLCDGCESAADLDAFVLLCYGD